MKLILEIDGVVSTRYKYNLWSVVEYEDGTIDKDFHIEHSDDLAKFMVALERHIQEVEDS